MFFIKVPYACLSSSESRPIDSFLHALARLKIAANNSPRPKSQHSHVAKTEKMNFEQTYVRILNVFLSRYIKVKVNHYYVKIYLYKNCILDQCTIINFYVACFENSRSIWIFSSKCRCLRWKGSIFTIRIWISNGQGINTSESSQYIVIYNNFFSILFTLLNINKKWRT